MLSKRALLDQLRAIDSDRGSQKRVLVMETEFRDRVNGLLSRLPARAAHLSKFRTSPFVLLEYARLRNYGHVGELEGDVLPAKLFSSMETSAGNMVQSVALPVYGWEDVKSKGYSIDSELDGRRVRKKAGVVDILTLKSGPLCLNDSTAKSIADSVRVNAERWAAEASCQKVEFTYSVLYGTERRSNKKDWQILRNLSDDVQAKQLRERPDGQWSCSVSLGRVDVTARVRIGADLWRYIGGSDLALVEIGCALIRACIDPSPKVWREEYVIGDMAKILSLPRASKDFNSVTLQRSQLEWLFLFMWHFCDYFEDDAPVGRARKVKISKR